MALDTSGWLSVDAAGRICLGAWGGGQLHFPVDETCPSSVERGVGKVAMRVFGLVVVPLSFEQAHHRGVFQPSVHTN